MAEARFRLMFVCSYEQVLRLVEAAIPGLMTTIRGYLNGYPGTYAAGTGGPVGAGSAETIRDGATG